MTISSNRRDLVLGTVGAAIGGSVVACAFAAASFLRESQSLCEETESYSGGSTDAESTHKFIPKWFTNRFRSIFLMQGNRTAGIRTSKNWACLCCVAQDGLENKTISSLGHSSNITGSCDNEVLLNKIVTTAEIVSGSVPALSEEQAQSFCKSPTHSISNGDMKADPFDPAKRKGYLSWDDYFMAIAFLSAQRSKDPNRQVGACLVSQDHVILGIGYNGFPRGCPDDELPWAKMSVDGDPLKTKYPYVCHAEVNAILNKNHASAAGQRLYVTMFPCNECAKVIIQAQIAEVVYFIDKGQGKSKNVQAFAYTASQTLLAMAGVKVWQYKPTRQALVLEYR